MNQIIMSKQGRALTGPCTNGDLIDEDIRNNPSFQRMIENYASLLQQQQHNISQFKQSQSNAPDGRPVNKGPSWC